MRVWPQQRVLIFLLLAVFVLGQFSFFNVVRDQFRFLVGLPVRAANSLGARAKNVATTIIAAGTISQENARLKQQINEDKAQIAQLKSVENENATLRNDLHFSSAHPEIKLLPATVISFSPSSVDQSIIIDQGEKAGIKEGQAVVSQGFLIGKIKKVSVSTAEIWLLANRNLLTPVQLTSSRTTGLLSGGIRGLVINNIPVDTKVEKGELVVTSNLEGLYPAGIAVGVVEEIVSRKEEIFQAARISSPVNISAISQVFVASL